jgi:hypothetical protein
VWFDYTNGKIRVNTARGRVKSRTLREGAGVALAILDPDNPYRYLQVRGRVSNCTEQGPSISTLWPKNTLARTSIRSGNRAKCELDMKSSRLQLRGWVEEPVLAVG